MSPGPKVPIHMTTSRHFHCQLEAMAMGSLSLSQFLSNLRSFCLQFYTDICVKFSGVYFKYLRLMEIEVYAFSCLRWLFYVNFVVSCYTDIPWRSRWPLIQSEVNLSFNYCDLNYFHIVSLQLLTPLRKTYFRHLLTPCNMNLYPNPASQQSKCSVFFVVVCFVIYHCHM